MALAFACAGCLGESGENSVAREARPPSLQPTQVAARPNSAPEMVPRETFDLNAADAVESRIAADLRYLASDELGGRGPFTEGLEKAADYIAKQFQHAGLETRRFGSQPYQIFRSQVRTALGTSNRLTLSTTAGFQLTLTGQQDFTPLSLSRSGVFDAPLAFAGYGIVCPELDWDDYASLDVQGKIVILLRHGPVGVPEFAAARGKREGGRFVECTYLLSKVKNAAERGAAGVLLVTDSPHLPESTEPDAKSLDPLLHFQVEGKLDQPAIPVLHCRREPIDQLLSTLDQPSLAELEQGSEQAAKADLPPGDSAADSPSGERKLPAAFVLTGARAAGEVTIERRTLTLKNVLGEIPGRGRLADETVIVGAHYDHLGMGGASSLAPWTKAIHNGADDNASGTAGLIEVARQVAGRNSTEHSRRVLFVAFSAEEMGLIGSERFVASPPVPMSSVVAMLNLDMVGRLRDDRLLVSGTGTAAEFSTLVKRLGSQQQLVTKLDPSGYGPSDHATFASRGIPVLHFFTGLHQDYHRPSDDFDRINITGLRRIVEMVADATTEIAESETRPTPTGGGLDDLLADLIPRRANGAARSKPADAASAPPASGNATPSAEKSVRIAGRDIRPGLGIEIENRVEGAVVIKRVFSESVAERAGLRVGDEVRRVGESEVRSVAEMLRAVKKHAAGATERFVIQRGQTQLELELTW
jgi:hypothetical protein